MYLHSGSNWLRWPWLCQKDKSSWIKIEHLGDAIGANVEIGSNSTIDRGSIGNT